jgi:hypothetical protein
MIIQRKRTRGWRWPINAIYVGRPTKWGNPHKVGSSLYAVDEAVNRFRRDLIYWSTSYHDRGCKTGA